MDYLEKPFTPDQLRAILIKAKKARQTQAEMAQLKDTVRDLKTEVRHMSPPVSFTSRDDQTKKELDMLFRAAATNASILILGESGTGKSVIARMISVDGDSTRVREQSQRNEGTRRDHKESREYSDRESRYDSLESVSRD